MEYRTVADLNRRIVDWSSVLPEDLDLVAGIPRSGMLAANLLALHRHLPLTDLAGLCEGRVMRAGQRCGVDLGSRQRLKVLVVDDSVFSGVSLDEARAQVAAANLPHKVLFGAVFATPGAVRGGKVARFSEVVPGPRAFEWNIMQIPAMSRFCVDLDGLVRASRGVDSKGGRPRGRSSTRPVTASLLPRHRIGWVVAWRPEEDREEIERSLRLRGIRYGALVLADSTRRDSHEVVFKAESYLQTGAELFLDSSPETAAAVAERAGKPVFCTASREMLYPGDYPRFQHLPLRPPHPIEMAARWAGRLPMRVARKAGRMVRGEVPASGGRAPSDVADATGRDPGNDSRVARPMKTRSR